MKGIWVFVIIAFVLVILVIIAMWYARKQNVQNAMLQAQQNAVPLTPAGGLGLQQPTAIIMQTKNIPLATYHNLVAPANTLPSGKEVPMPVPVKAIGIKL